MFKTFCCCLPVRLGVFVLSAFTFLVAGTLSVVSWRMFSQDMAILATSEKIGTALGALSWTLLAIFSVVGFIGTLSASLNFVSAYSRVLFGHWIIDLGITVAYLIIWLKVAQQIFVAKCVEGSGDFISNLAGNFTAAARNATQSLSNDPLVGQIAQNLTSTLTGNINNGTADLFNEQNRTTLCQDGFTAFKIALIVVLVIYKLITLYGCIISHRYVVQLRGEQTEKRWNQVEQKVNRMEHDRMRLPGAGAV